jgi:hypothetical protein
MPIVRGKRCRRFAALREEIQRLNGLNTLMMQTEDKQMMKTLKLVGTEMALLVLATT